ncbi:MAG: HAD family hydrolase [Candidatus Sumerlaeia bacterium]|nr:HAD family hydrolase [Candidatus Sumerlaeia bacterium]
MQSSQTQSYFLPGTEIEIINPALPRGQFRSVLFDFDGTLSLIREGWPDVMIPMMVEILAAQPTHEPEDQLYRLVEGFVMRLNGRQTIYQMIQLCEEIRQRGGTPEDPLVYKRMYYERLNRRIAGRIEGLRSGRIAREDMLLPGAIELLEALRRRGLTLYLASGTDEPFMKEEARLLGLTEYFNGGIFGALDDYRRFSKQMLIADMFRRHGLRGPQLLAFGDGFVEIENTKEFGGVAIGVASDEVRRCGINQWKRDRLVRAGADIIIPEYRQHAVLLEYLFPPDCGGAATG